MSAGLEEQPVIDATGARALVVKAKPSPLLYGCVTVSALAWGVFGYDTARLAVRPPSDRAGIDWRDHRDVSV